MYENIDNNLRQDQYKILRMRAYNKAKELNPNLTQDDFRIRFRDPEQARPLLSDDDFELYTAVSHIHDTIIAEHQDLNDRFCLIFTVEIHIEDYDNIDIIQAMRDAARKYCMTPEGRNDVEYNSGNFNWGDIAASLPDDICAKHGFQIISTVVTENIVDHNESFTNPD